MASLMSGCCSIGLGEGSIALVTALLPVIDPLLEVIGVAEILFEVIPTLLDLVRAFLAVGLHQRQQIGHRLVPLVLAAVAFAVAEHAVVDRLHDFTPAGLAMADWFSFAHNDGWEMGNMVITPFQRSNTRHAAPE